MAGRDWLIILGAVAVGAIAIVTLCLPGTWSRIGGSITRSLEAASADAMARKSAAEARARWSAARAREVAADRAAATLGGPGTYSLNVVGESNYQAGLEWICGGRSARGADKAAEATLTLEDDNPADAQAVRVDIRGRTVGYLDRQKARAFRKHLSICGLRGETFYCEAKIVGGWDNGGGDVGHFGVRLDLAMRRK